MQKILSAINDKDFRDSERHLAGAILFSTHGYTVMATIDCIPRGAASLIVAPSRLGRLSTSFV